MTHQWRDVRREILDKTDEAVISDQYKALIGAQTRINGMGSFCDGDDCGPAEAGGYFVHRPPCMMLASSRTDEENEGYQEVCE